MKPTDVGWRLGRAWEPRGGSLWVPWDRTTGVIGPQGSGKTLDLLLPALLGAPGAALATTTKPEDVLLSYTERISGGRPCTVLDPFGLLRGLPELVWDPIAGCADAWLAQRRASALCTGTLTAGNTGRSDAARFYAAEAAKVTAGFLHAAALANLNLDDLLRWVANPLGATQPVEILRAHPQAAAQWHGLVSAALHGDERTASNTATTLQQAFGVFFQPDIRTRCTPSRGRPATDLTDLIQRNGTIYLLGRDDPYAPATPMLTAVAEHILDLALALGHRSPWGRLCPPLLACFDELPSIAPLPTLRTRMANERALGISFLWAAQSWRQLVAVFGDIEARALLGLTNVLVVFGGSSDVAFNQELSKLSGETRVPRSSWQPGTGRGVHGGDLAVLTADEIRLIPEHHALILADQGRPFIARLNRCTTGSRGARLLTHQADLRRHLHTDQPTPTAAAEPDRQRCLPKPGTADPSTPEPETDPRSSRGGAAGGAR